MRLSVQGVKSLVGHFACLLGQAIRPLWDFCAPISIIVELSDWYQLFLNPQKITGSSSTIYYNNKNRCAKGPKILICTA